MKSGGAFPGRVSLALAFVFVLSSSAWAGEPAKRLKIVASLFPQYDFALAIAGGRADVGLLLPPGAESHSYEPTPSDMREIAEADLFIYTGPLMEPWAKRMADAAVAGGRPVIIDISPALPEESGGAGGGRDHDPSHDHADAPHAHGRDPHVWLDPRVAISMAEDICAAMAELDPANAETYQENAAALQAELKELDAGFRELVERSPRRALVFGERFAFAWFFERYGLEEVGAYKSCAPGAEPGVRAVIEVMKYIRDNGVHYVYREEMSQGRISEVLSRETGVEILAVDSLHNIPADRLGAGPSYVEVMRRNMDAFARGLQ